MAEYGAYDPEFSPPLGLAIEYADPKRLREILHKLVLHNIDAAKELKQELLFDEATTIPGMVVNSRKRKQAPTEEQPVDASSNKRRYRPRYLMCERCHQEYDVSKNGSNACRYHEEGWEKNEESEAWDDTDDWPEEYLDMDEIKREWPNSFKWLCCDKNCDAAGCQVGRHVQNPLDPDWSDDEK